MKTVEKFIVKNYEECRDIELWLSLMGYITSSGQLIKTTAENTFPRTIVVESGPKETIAYTVDEWDKTDKENQLEKFCNSFGKSIREMIVKFNTDPNIKLMSWHDNIFNNPEFKEEIKIGFLNSSIKKDNIRYSDNIYFTIPKENRIFGYFRESSPYSENIYKIIILKFDNTLKEDYFKKYVDFLSKKGFIWASGKSFTVSSIMKYVKTGSDFFQLDVRDKRVYFGRLEGLDDDYKKPLIMKIEDLQEIFPDFEEEVKEKNLLKGEISIKVSDDNELDKLLHCLAKYGYLLEYGGGYKKSLITGSKKQLNNTLTGRYININYKNIISSVVTDGNIFPNHISAENWIEQVEFIEKRKRVSSKILYYVNILELLCCGYKFEKYPDLVFKEMTSEINERNWNVIVDLEKKLILGYYKNEFPLLSEIYKKNKENDVGVFISNSEFPEVYQLMVYDLRERGNIDKIITTSYVKSLWENSLFKKFIDWEKVIEEKDYSSIKELYPLYIHPIYCIDFYEASFSDFKKCVLLFQSQGFRIDLEIRRALIAKNNSEDSYSNCKKRFLVIDNNFELSLKESVFDLRNKSIIVSIKTFLMENKNIISRIDLEQKLIGIENPQETFTISEKVEEISVNDSCIDNKELKELADIKEGICSNLEGENIYEEVNQIAHTGFISDKGIDWSVVSGKPELPEWFIDKYKNYLDWKYISKCQVLSEDFINTHKDYVYWRFISEYQTLSEEFIEKFKDRVDWVRVSNSQTLSEKFIEKYKNRVDWLSISTSQVLSSNFIKKYKDVLDREFISRFQPFIDPEVADKELYNEYNYLGKLYQETKDKGWFVGYIEEDDFNSSPKEFEFRLTQLREYNKEVKIYWEDLTSPKECAKKFYKLNERKREFSEGTIIIKQIESADRGILLKVLNFLVELKGFEFIGLGNGTIDDIPLPGESDKNLVMYIRKEYKTVTIREDDEVIVDPKGVLNISLSSFYRNLRDMKEEKSLLLKTPSILNNDENINNFKNKKIMKSSMFDGIIEKFKSQYVPEIDNNIMISMDGNLCLKAGDEAVSISNDSCEVVSYPIEMCFDIPGLLISKPVNMIVPGDIVKFKETYYKVLEVSPKGSLKVISFSTGTVSSKKTVKDFVTGSNLVKVIINFMNGVNSGLNMQSQGINPAMMAMMFQEEDSDDMLKNMIMMGMMNPNCGLNTFTGGMMNPIMMAMMMKDQSFSGEGNIFKTIAMMSMFNSGGMFQFGNNNNQVISSQSEEKGKSTRKPRTRVVKKDKSSTIERSEDESTEI